MAPIRPILLLGACAFALASLLPSGKALAVPAKARVDAKPPAVAADQVLVRFNPDVGPYFVRTVDIVLGLKGAQKAEGAHTWRFGIGERGTRDDYATLFATLPYVAQVWPSPGGGARPRPSERSYVEGELLVKFKSSVSQAQIDAFNARHGVTALDKISGIEVWRLKLPAGRTVEAMQQIYEASGLVEYAEPNHKVSVPLLPDMMPAVPEPAPQKTEPQVAGTGSVEVQLAPGASAALVSLVYGTPILSQTPEGCVRLAPTSKSSADTAARVLRLCPSVLSATVSS